MRETDGRTVGMKLGEGKVFGKKHKDSYSLELFGKG